MKCWMKLLVEMTVCQDLGDLTQDTFLLQVGSPDFITQQSSKTSVGGEIIVESVWHVSIVAVTQLVRR